MSRLSSTANSFCTLNSRVTFPISRECASDTEECFPQSVLTLFLGRLCGFASALSFEIRLLPSPELHNRTGRAGEHLALKGGINTTVDGCHIDGMQPRNMRVRGFHLVSCRARQLNSCKHPISWRRKSCGSAMSSALRQFMAVVYLRQVRLARERCSLNKRVGVPTGRRR